MKLDDAPFALRYAVARKPLTYHLLRADAPEDSKVLCHRPLQAMMVLDSPPPDLPLCQKCLFRLKSRIFE